MFLICIHFKREDTLEEEIKQLQEELRNSEDNCRFISKTCDEKLEDASNKVELIQMEKEKDRVMMEASIKRLELENSSWQSKFRDKVWLDVIFRCRLLLNTA